MSETKTYKGILIPTGKTLDQFMADEQPEWYEDSHEDEEDLKGHFYDCYYENKVVIDGHVYGVEKEDISYEDIFLSIKRDGDDIDFLVQYYDGATSFDEAIDYAVENCNG